MIFRKVALLCAFVFEDSKGSFFEGFLGGGATKVAKPLKQLEFHKIDLTSQFTPTEDIEKFLKGKNSKFFPNPKMGNIVKYFEETLGEIMLFQNSVSDSGKEISRSSAFLSTLPKRIEKVVKMVKKGEEKALQHVENLIAAFFFLDKHRIEIWDGPAEKLPSIVLVFRNMLDMVTNEKPEDYQKWGWIATCLTQAVIVRRAKLRADIFKGDGKSVIGVSPMIDVFPNLRALEAISDPGRSLIDVFPNLRALEAISDSGRSLGSDQKTSGSTFQAGRTEVRGATESYCRGVNKKREKLTEQSTAEVVKKATEASSGQEAALTIDKAVKFVEVMGRYSATDLLVKKKRDSLIDWVKGTQGAPTLQIN
jgi:hypothetical protein